jgi:two-component system response regulator
MARTCRQNRNCIAGLDQGPQTRSDTVDTGRYNVLLLDDDLDQIDLARRAAVESFRDIELIAVTSGDGVLDWLRTVVRNNEQLPHIILLDLKLPKLDGLALLRKLRSFSPTGEIPIVVYSAVYTQPDVLMSYRAGANSFVAKPADVAGYAEFFRERLAYWMQPQQRRPLFTPKDGAGQGI